MRYYHNYFKLFQRDSAVKCSYNLKYIQRVKYKGFSLDHMSMDPDNSSTSSKRQFSYYCR